MINDVAADDIFCNSKMYYSDTVSPFSRDFLLQNVELAAATPFYLSGNHIVVSTLSLIYAYTTILLLPLIEKNSKRRNETTPCYDD